MIDSICRKIYTTALSVGICCLIVLFSIDVQAQSKNESEVMEGVVIPKVTEKQLENVSKYPVGRMIYKSDGESGFYLSDGFKWIKVSQDDLKSPSIKINNKEISELGIEYLGPVGGANPRGHVFMNKRGFYFSILNTDKLSRVDILFRTKDCLGKGYVSSVVAGRGFVANSGSGLIYVPKDAELVSQLDARGRAIIGVDGTMICQKYVTSWQNVFPISNNEEEVTNINLDPTDEYRVSFGN